MIQTLRISMLKAVLCCAIYTLFCSCNNEPRRQGNDKRIVDAIGIVPREDTLKPARVTNLDTCAPPTVITVPDKPTPAVTPDKQAYTLDRPGIKPAGFYVPMTTYAAEQGLYSTIKCVKIDRNGNIWFGTFGGGVSRYDGKRFTTFSATNGLANNIVHCIAEDRAGNLWFGTYGGGVSRYDGRSFTNFTTADGLANNVVLSIAEDKTGHLWFGTYGGGVSRYDPSATGRAGTRAFTTYDTSRGLANNAVLSIAEDKSGNLWFGTDGGGVSKYDPLKKGSKPFTTFTTENGLADNSVWSVIEGKNGILWFGTHRGVSRFDPSIQPGTGTSPFVNYTTAQGLANNTVLCVVEDKVGTLWFGTQGGGVSRYDPSAAKDTTATPFTTYSTANGLVNNMVNCIAEDKTGSLWFGTEGGGVSQYHGKSLTTYTTVQGLANNIVISIAEDKKGSLWFGTDGSGVCRFDPPTASKTHAVGAASGIFTTYTTAQGLANNGVLCVLEDRNGSMWFGTGGGGVSRLDPAGLSVTGHERFTTYRFFQGLAGNVVYRILEDKAGNIWLGTGGGVSKYDGKSFTTYTTAQGLVHNSVWAVTEDKKGNIWFGTSGGVSRYTPPKQGTGQGTFTNFTTAQGLANNVVYSITEDTAGNLWFGTDGGGVSRYDGKSLVTYATADGLSNNVVFGIDKDNAGNLWLGTNEGFSVLTGYRQITPRDKNAGNSSGNTLPASNKLSNQDIANNFAPVFEQYNFRNGYPIKDLNTNALYIDSKNIVWAGTGDKLIRFDRSSTHRDTEPPHVFINAVKINRENIIWNDLLAEREKSKGKKTATEDSMAIVNEEVCTFGDVLTPAIRDTLHKKYAGVYFDSISRFYPVPMNLTLPYRQHNISFDFAAAEPSRSHSVNYQYKLEGYDEDWSLVTNISNAAFGNLHEGTYTFKVKAQSADGAWSAPVTYTFTVLPPLYRTWSAYASYLIAILCSLFALFSWRTAKLRKEKENLEKIVAERTAQVLEEKAKVVKLVQEQEQTIADRTKELAESNAKLAHSNTKLLELIQYNSHYMREPLARVMGAISISEFVSNEEFFSDIMPQMNRAAHDLDNCIMEVIKVADETIELYK